MGMVSALLLDEKMGSGVPSFPQGLVVVPVRPGQVEVSRTGRLKISGGGLWCRSRNLDVGAGESI